MSRKASDNVEYTLRSLSSLMGERRRKQPEPDAASAAGERSLLAAAESTASLQSAAAGGGGGGGGGVGSAGGGGWGGPAAAAGRRDQARLQLCGPNLRSGPRPHLTAPATNFISLGLSFTFAMRAICLETL
jgi:hypothetical protein